MSNQHSDGRERVALLHGCDNSLGMAVAQQLAERGVRIILHAPSSTAQPLIDVEPTRTLAIDALLDTVVGESEEALVTRAASIFGRLDILVNLCIPRSSTTTRELAEYPSGLLERGLHAGSVMVSRGRGAIVNHCFLPSMYSGTAIGPYMPVLKGAVTGVTRMLCCRLGKQGIRINTVQTGLIDVPETKMLASPEVLRLNTPVGRWGTACDVASLVRFLALTTGYMTGQAVVLDGGMTSGNTGI
jgi:NAD(P)-dependent dehydrogenase (short-subunit alcohol dehydrogenase family)